MASRSVIRVIRACSPREETVEWLNKPRFAVWGGRMNLRKQVEPLLSAALQASSEQRHAQHATSRLAWVKTLAQTSLRKPSRAKQELRDLSARSWVGQGALTAWGAATCPRTSSTSFSSCRARSFSSPCTEVCWSRARKYSS